MEILFAVAVIGLWAAISVVALKRAFGSHGPSLPASSPHRPATHMASGGAPHGAR